MSPKIAIIGAGEVGGAAAYALILHNICATLLLVDKRSSHRDGQVRDLKNSTFKEQNGAHVQAATYKEAAQADIVIIMAAAKRGIGETSLQYLHRSTATLRNIIEAMKPFKRDGILLIVTNPVDVLTSLAQELSGLPPTQVIGTGTFLDSVRLRGMLSDQFGVAASSIDAMVLGEHCGSMFVPWSLVEIGGVPIDDIAGSDGVDKVGIALKCKREGECIIEEKGAITFGIASVISTICTSILLDRRQVYPVSHMQQELGCSLSMPAVLGRSGIERTLPIPLVPSEKQELLYSAREIKATIERLKD
ncbi:L-lactate/malate dehydrogenase [Curvularia clavata]|uniref:L-lactate/malate dehydrogenase n=1 Tax=Curvularia clavata TaxID=95742 RepID=A0A9Q8ZFC3_CURCL|nr:L-lactate/malate dehydrogenase [Curvularia clavata]